TEHRAGGRQIDVAAWLVWFCFERETIVVALIDRVLAEEVQSLAVPLQRLARILRGIDFRAFAPAPKDVNLRSELRAEIHRAHRLLQRVQPDARGVRRESTILENRIVEEIRRRHRHLHAGIVERLFELADYPIAVSR